MGYGTFGNKRPADVNPSDIEVIVIYSATRNGTVEQEITKYNGTEVISSVLHNDDTGGNNGIEILGGLYNLELPTTVFNKKGFYTIYIRPAQIRMQVEDCAPLSTFSDIKGLVFDSQKAPTDFISKFTNNGLDGYRIEYLDTTGAKIPNVYRIITSSFLAEPVVENSDSNSQKTIKYVYNNSSTLVFCTVVPNVAPSFKPTATPFIGQKGMSVIITNTYFNPIVLEIEMVDYDLESLAISLYGEQTKSVTDGIYTLYDFDGNIYAQYDLYEIRNELDEKLFEVRKKRADNEIDSDKARDNIIN